MDDSFGTAFAIDPSKIPNDSVVLTSNALGQPIVMSKDRLLNAIPSSASLRQICEACGKFPGEKDFAICSACKGSKYCSKQCQKVRWPEHKPICIQMRQINEEAAKATSEGREYFNPFTMKQWYRKNNNAVEYAAFHCLEIYKGHLSKYSPAKFAVWFAFERRGQDPNDVDSLSLQSVDPVPMALAQKMGLTEERLEIAVRNRMMVLLFMDKKNPVPTILEFHQIPDKDWVKPDEYWFWQVKMYKSNLTSATD
ncbi:hypothetical protein F5876DRAFT_79527 [Lentinula aff. lateritia]|uniref:Uncharacterized protein n=1 Tax=Lentinula aff. lateritia TaxID=2804960 RepID=A0ACC1TSU2_9AGAR|nr:hypothetical protein F5876DRAFT_79527 [Lentinula aff. lateritia]